jgi:hypothetical protein
LRCSVASVLLFFVQKKNRTILSSITSANTWRTKKSFKPKWCMNTTQR